MSESQQKPVFINPSVENPDVYVGKVDGVQISVQQLDDGTLGFEDGGKAMTYPPKTNSYGNYWIVDIKERPWLVSFGKSKQRNNPYAKFVLADKIGMGGDRMPQRKGPAQFGKR